MELSFKDIVQAHDNGILHMRFNPYFNGTFF